MPIRIASLSTTVATSPAKLIIASTLVAAAGTAIANPLRPDPPLDVSLYVERGKAGLDYPGARVPTRTDRIGIQWRERYDTLWLGLVGGYSFVTQTERAATAGRELNGYHVGVAFSLEVVPVSPFGVSLAGGYLYERVDEASTGSDLELAWHTPYLQLLGYWRAASNVELRGGIRYDYLEGEERVSGPSTTSASLEHRGKTSGVAGLQITLDDTGYIALEGNGGATRSVALYFGRRY